MNMKVTEIIFLLDRSSSMKGLENNTIGGFNAFIEKQQHLEGDTLVTAVLFDHQYELLWTGIDACEVRLTNKEYYVRGSTALLDAVGKTILDVGHRLSLTNEHNRPGKVIFVITTDGMENASTNFTYAKIKELITHQQENYNWEFIFLGANMDSAKEANSMGIEDCNAYSFEASELGVAEMYSVVCEAVSEIRLEGPSSS